MTAGTAVLLLLAACTGGDTAQAPVTDPIAAGTSVSDTAADGTSAGAGSVIRHRRHPG